MALDKVIFLLNFHRRLMLSVEQERRGEEMGGISRIPICQAQCNLHQTEAPEGSASREPHDHIPHDHIPHSTPLEELNGGP